MDAPTCPHCGELTGSTLACLSCHAILREDPGVTHFARLGIAPSARVDLDALEPTYLRLSRLLHPDFQTDADEERQLLALMNSALLNDAWRLFGDAQELAEYALGVLDSQALERAKTLDPMFLMESIELSEEIEEARARDDEEALSRIEARVHSEIAARMDAVIHGYQDAQPDTDALATRLHEARVFRRVLRDTKGVRNP